MKYQIIGIMRNSSLVVTLLFIVFISSSVLAQNIGDIHFSISMEKPSTHYYHIEMTCSQVQGEVINVKLPAWTPGYYWLVNFSKNVINFNVRDDKGNSLSWDKTNKNTWSVKATKSKTIIVSYDVYAFTKSVADPYLDDTYGYVSPAGLFMYVDGQLKHPATLSVHPFKKWKTISTGLDQVIGGESNTYRASDFDVLYDSPLLLGNQEVLSFDVRGIHHYVALMEPEKFDKQKFVADLKRIVETASSVIGDIPYKHYTFLIMGDGRGGLEHLNSTAVFSSGSVYNNGDEEGYKRWLNFLTHEYFHLYNIKAIRPVALGPFDYDKENYSHMLWVSEGFTVYYEYLILNRAGIHSRKDVFDFLRDNIRDYENGSGKLFQSATQSSFDTWLNFFNHNENTSNTTISYYDKGAALGMLLDLKIRYATKNVKSLDDVMRALYFTYYKEKKRGFTDAEFQATCEAIAGVSLAELFEYASTVMKIDYEKYLNYAGVHVDDHIENTAGSYLGASFQEDQGILSITAIDLNSPATVAGLSTLDDIITVNGESVSAKRFGEILKGKSEGDVLHIEYKRNGSIHSTDARLTKRQVKSFNFILMSNPDSFQSLILGSWLKD